MDQIHQSPAQPTLKTELRTVGLSLLVGCLLMGAKFFAYYLTRSAAIFSDAMENVVNVLTSAFAVYAILLAHRPADQEHPYGHGKVEFLSAGFEGGMILLAAIMIVVRAIQAFAADQPPTALVVGMSITGASTVLCAVTGLILWQVGKSNGSITLEADGVHLLSDAVTGAIVLVGLVLVKLTHVGWLDPAAALLVSAWIIWQGSGLVRRAAAGLMDEQDAADAAVLKRILDSHVRGDVQPKICGYHKPRHRHSGRAHWVDFHVQVPSGWNVEQAHQVASAVEMEIEGALSNCSATAHVEPCTEANCPGCASKVLS